ncbi:MAG: prepilin-type N-terminal cleavage/methylation domain-containing protein [Planctomycetota bacterium]
MKTHTPSPNRRTQGFTLTELLTSVSIIAVIMLIVFPVVGSLQNGSRIEAGLNTVGMSVDVARAWSTASLPQADLSSDPANPVFGASYSGTAVIFCPTGEVRVVINNQRATTDGNPPASNGGNALETFNLNGYRDYRQAHGGKRDLEYISIPQGTGVAGVYRNNTGAHLLAPPFAIAFDRDGMMVPGANVAGGNRVIYYDGNFNNEYDINATRPAGYNPRDWDFDSAVLDGAALVRHLPFEVIETVVGVVIYDKTDAEAAGFDFSGGGVYSETDPAGTGYDWLRENGTTVFFSPNTGVAMRDEGNE